MDNKKKISFIAMVIPCLIAMILGYQITQTITHNNIIALVAAVILAVVAFNLVKKHHYPVEKKINTKLDEMDQKKRDRDNQRIMEHATKMVYVAKKKLDSTTYHVFYGPVNIDPNTQERFDFVEYLSTDPEYAYLDLKKNYTLADKLRHHLHVNQWGLFNKNKYRLMPIYSSLSCPEHNNFDLIINDQLSKYKIRWREFLGSDDPYYEDDFPFYREYMSFDEFADKVSNPKKIIVHGDLIKDCDLSGYDEEIISFLDH